MGTYLNPGNESFERIRRTEYVDKSGMIGLLNSTINTVRNLTCVSRPRRFGKSYAAQMLCAYYDKTCESGSLFDHLTVATTPEYHTHLNRYDVIYLDMTQVMEEAGNAELADFIKEKVTDEIAATYPEVKRDDAFSTTLINMVEYTRNKVIMIIDEWDAPIREQPEREKKYLSFLRMLFKSSGTTARIFAAAYMTGILPIKKGKSQSAISDFQEYTMINPRIFAPYVGFTESEVQSLCSRCGLDFQEMKSWYDGYVIKNIGSVYNPNSVMEAVHNMEFETYWKKTSATESLQTYIDMDFDGLQQDIVRLIAGEKIAVQTDWFENDFVTFHGKDDVLTLLIHLGYLTLDEASQMAWIPNKEVRSEFEMMLRKGSHQKLVELVKASDLLLQKTLEGDEAAVAKEIERIHDSFYAPRFYNDEQALRSVIRFAYVTAIDDYIKIEELPGGHGMADVVYLPAPSGVKPAIVIELKWNKSPEGAIQQILDKRYPAVLEQYMDEIVLVGINYDEKEKKHTCRIRKVPAAS